MTTESLDVAILPRYKQDTTSLLFMVFPHMYQKRGDMSSVPSIHLIFFVVLMAETLDVIIVVAVSYSGICA